MFVMKHPFISAEFVFNAKSLHERKDVLLQNRFNKRSVFHSVYIISFDFWEDT